MFGHFYWHVWVFFPAVGFLPPTVKAPGYHVLYSFFVSNKGWSIVPDPDIIGFNYEKFDIWAVKEYLLNSVLFLLVMNDYPSLESLA